MREREDTDDDVNDEEELEEGEMVADDIEWDILENEDMLIGIDSFL